MFRLTASHIRNICRSSIGLSGRINAVRASSHCSVSAEEFEKQYEDFFKRGDIDGWEVRKGMSDLLGMDLVPSPPVVDAALHACRRINDIALAVRWLESVRDKCGDHEDEIYPYILKKIKPTLDELGIQTPEELGYNKPELALKSVDDM